MMGCAQDFCVFLKCQVARVLTVEEINSDKLFKTTIDIGGGEVRQVRCMQLYRPFTSAVLHLMHCPGDLPRASALLFAHVCCDGSCAQVVAGLKGHIERGALLGSLVVAILNLKPAKLAGEVSEAMLLAADAPGRGGKELVRTLIPPGAARVSRFVCWLLVPSVRLNDTVIGC